MESKDSISPSKSDLKRDEPREDSAVADESDYADGLKTGYGLYSLILEQEREAFKIAEEEDNRWMEKLRLSRGEKKALVAPVPRFTAEDSIETSKSDYAAEPKAGYELSFESDSAYETDTDDESDNWNEDENSQYLVFPNGVYYSVLHVLHRWFLEMARELEKENPDLRVLAGDFLELIKKHRDTDTEKEKLEETASKLLRNEKVLSALVEHLEDGFRFGQDVGCCFGFVLNQKVEEPEPENIVRLRADRMYAHFVEGQQTNVLCSALSIVFGYWLDNYFFNKNLSIAYFVTTVEKIEEEERESIERAREEDSQRDFKRPKKRVRPVFEKIEEEEEREMKNLRPSRGERKALVAPVPRFTAEDFEGPKKRVQPVVCSSQPNEENLIFELLGTAQSLFCKPLRVAWDTSAFGVEKDTPLFIHHNDVLEVVLGRVEPSMPIVQLWVMYLNSLSVDMGSEHHFGFFEPQSIQNLGKREEATSYIRKHMHNSKKQSYLGAFQQEEIWQLFVLLPEEGIVVWLCPQKREPDPLTKDTIEGLMKEHLELTKVADQWVYPEVFRQETGWESGYYVMHWMWFLLKNPLEDLAQTRGDKDEIRSQWARYFFEVKNRLDN